MFLSSHSPGQNAKSQDSTPSSSALKKKIYPQGNKSSEYCKNALIKSEVCHYSNPCSIEERRSQLYIDEVKKEAYRPSKRNQYMSCDNNRILPLNLNTAHNISNQDCQRIQKSEEACYDDFAMLTRSSKDEFDNYSNVSMEDSEADSLLKVGTIGRGSYGEVTLMFDIRRRLFFASKQQLTGAKALNDEVARDEWRALDKIRSTNSSSLLRIYNLRWVPRKHFSVLMEYGRGTLRNFINFTRREKYVWTAQDYIGIYVQLKEQLDKLKCVPLCHRDVKPENILFSRDGFLKLADFGLAQMVFKEGVQKMNIRGTPKYWTSAYVEARRRGEEYCEVDPYEADMDSVEIMLNLLMEENNEKQDIMSLIKATKKSLSPYIPIYDEHKEEYSVQVFDNLCENPSKKIKYERLHFFVNWGILGEVSRWLSAKQYDLKDEEEYWRFCYLAGEVFSKSGHYHEAIKYYELSLSRVPRRTNLSISISNIYGALGSAKIRRISEDALDQELAFEAAKDHLDKSIRLKIEVYGEKSAQVAEGMTRLAEISRFRGLRADAFDKQMNALDTYKAGYNNNETIIDEIYNAIALELEALGRYGQAEAVLLKNIDYIRKRRGEDHPDMARAMNQLGRICNNMYRPEKALEYLMSSLRILNALSVPNNLILSNIYVNIGISYNLLEKWESAKNSFLDAQSVLERVTTKSVFNMCISSYIAEASIRVGCFKSVDDLFGPIIDTIEGLQSNNYLLISTVWYNYGISLKYSEQYHEAEEKFNKSIEYLSKVLPKHHRISVVKGQLGEIKVLEDKFTVETLEYLSDALDLLEDAFPHNHGDIARCLFNISKVCFHLEKYTNAENYKAMAIEVAKKVFSPNHSLRQRLNEESAASEAIGLNTKADRSSEGHKNISRWLCCQREI